MKEIENEISKVKMLSISCLIFTLVLFGLTAVGYHEKPNPVWPERGAMYFMFGLVFVSYTISIFS